MANAALKEAGVLYDLDKLIYLGSAHSTYHWVFITRRDAGFASLEALRQAPGIRIGAQAVRPFQLFRRPPVCLDDRPERTENARWLLWK